MATKKPERASVVLSAKLQSPDASADDLFEQVDTDGDGHISKAEFKELYRVITATIQTGKDEVASANRRAKLLRVFGALMITFVLLMLMGNMGLGYVMYTLTKELTVKGDGQMISTTGSVVQTGTSIEEVTLADHLPEDLNSATAFYDRMTNLVVPSVDGTTVHSHRISSWTWSAGPPIEARFFTELGDQWKVTKETGLEVVSLFTNTTNMDDASSNRRELRRCPCPDSTATEGKYGQPRQSSWCCNRGGAKALRRM